MPLAVRHGQNGVAVLFRYGVAVLIGLSAEEEAAFLQKIAPRVVGKLGVAEEENAFVEIAAGAEDQISAGGPVVLGDMSLPRMLIVADALAKSVALASDERDVTKVFGVIDPFAAELAAHGRTRRNRTEILKLIGNALLVQHRVSGRVAVAEKPDALWDRHDLERLYARLEDEYELKERVRTLDRKLNVIADTAENISGSHRYDAFAAPRAHRRAADRNRNRNQVLIRSSSRTGRTNPKRSCRRASEVKVAAYLGFSRKILGRLTTGASIPADTFPIMAVLSFALSAALFIYGAWTWIIQSNGDVYYHWAGFAAVAGAIFLVIGLVRRRRRA